MNETNNFQPTLLGTEIIWESDPDGGDPGMVTDETQDSVFIESDFFTGWITKPLFLAYVNPQ